MSPWEQILSRFVRSTALARFDFLIRKFAEDGLVIQIWHKPPSVKAKLPFHQNERLSVDYIASRLSYEPESGLLRWKPLLGDSVSERAWNAHGTGNLQARWLDVDLGIMFRSTYW